MPGHPVTAWPAEDGIDVRDALTMQDIARTWGAYYFLEYSDGMYRATRPDGVDLPPADTPEGLDSAIRADWARWHAR